MPAAVLYALARQAGETPDRAEDYWAAAKKSAATKFKKPVSKFTDREWSYVTGIAKKRLGLGETVEVVDESALLAPIIMGLGKLAGITAQIGAAIVREIPLLIAGLGFGAGQVAKLSDKTFEKTKEGFVYAGNKGNKAYQFFFDHKGKPVKVVVDGEVVKAIDPVDAGDMIDRVLRGASPEAVILEFVNG